MALTSPNPMVDYYVSHCSNLVLLHFMQQGFQQLLRTICRVKGIQILWKVTYKEEENY